MNSPNPDKDFATLDKTGKYNYVQSSLEALFVDENDMIANLGNTTALLNEVFNWLWVGFYIVKGNELVLGPFQGPVACTRIAFGKGVCGKCWEAETAIIVPNVHEFPGHISCSALSMSEIVLPAFREGIVVAVLDIDSDKLSAFDEHDKESLNSIISKIPIWH